MQTLTIWGVIGGFLVIAGLLTELVLMLPIVAQYFLLFGGLIWAIIAGIRWMVRLWAF